MPLFTVTVTKDVREVRCVELEAQIEIEAEDAQAAEDAIWAAIEDGTVEAKYGALDFSERDSKVVNNEDVSDLSVDEVFEDLY